MAPNRSKRPSESRARRLSEPGALWHAQLRSAFRWPTVLAAVFCAGAFVIVLSGRERLPYFLGQAVEHPVFSRVRFDRINQAKTAEIRRRAQQEVPNYYRLNTALIESIEAQFRDLLAAVKAAESLDQYAASETRRWALSAGAFAALSEMTDEAGSAHYVRESQGILKRLATQDMVERVERDRGVLSRVAKLDRGDGTFRDVPKESLIYAVNPDNVKRAAELAVGRTLSPDVRSTLTEIVRASISPESGDIHSLYVLDDTQTGLMNEAAAQTDPVRDVFQPGDRLMAAGATIGGDALDLLRAEHVAYLALQKIDPDLKSAWRKETAGLFGLILLITIGLSIHTWFSQRRAAENPLRAAALALLLLAMLFADRALFLGLGASPVWSVATIAMTAAILTIAYSHVFAVGATAFLALLTILTLDGRIGLFMIHLTVLAVTVSRLRDIRTRLKMVEAGAITALAAFVATTFVGLTYQEVPGFIAKQSSYAALAALGGISVVLVLLPLIESAFRMTTSLTLLEWADTSNPLLRRLIEKAPGTWQHSHLLGSMAEAAAEEIGANGLLVRVGAYYHDIGKMLKPQYFVENQQGQSSAHRNLAPTISLLVILAHVKDGLAMAREHRLPRVLHQFIAEHHGTTVVRYFHAMASQESKARGGRESEVSESEFRYPGPRPRTRESAILMLCDGVEGAVRSLQEPTPGRIEAVVREIAMGRLMDGQFDDCEITLRELAKVERSLVKSLRAFHHGRIAYPKSPSATASQARIA